MEFYPHHQQQQTVQEVDSMATGSSNITSPHSNNNLNNVNSSSSNISNNNSNNINNTSPTSTTVTTADAATVAVAKDMLQLHQGGIHNNKNNTNNSNCSSNTILSTIDTATVTSPLQTTITTTATILNNPPAHASDVILPDNALGFLKFDQEILYITEPCTVIGRNSSTSHVNFHVAENNLVSRKHFQVLYDTDTHDFYIQCLSKNGIFVDDYLQRRNAEPLKLPVCCYFRFPSTEIRIQFESFLQNSSNNNSAAGNVGSAHVIISNPSHLEEHQHGLSHHHNQQHHHQHTSTIGSSSSASSHLLPMDSSNIIYSPLKISIPKKEQKSPYLSPTGTISAANSCPASPRQGFHQNQANYNNYSNNSLQNQDLFQTPSTASYNHNEKPPYSYAQLIVQAISAAPDKQLTLSGIYSFIVKHYPYYRKETNKGWQNSIRHNLSLNRYFIKVARSQDEPGKGSFWRIDPDSGAKLIDHSYKKRRQRSSQGFRPPYGMPRSAPVSPSHMEYLADNSRESSPLQDIVLQSAPGSPGMSLENRATDGDLIYNSQNIHQASINNTHNQYNNSSTGGSPYYVTTQNSVIGGPQQQSHNEVCGAGNTNTGNGVGALIALKRNHAMAAAAQQQQQSLHPDIIYEELPTDYSGNIESGDECDSAKRSKYVSEVL